LYNEYAPLILCGVERNFGMTMAGVIFNWNSSIFTDSPSVTSKNLDSKNPDLGALFELISEGSGVVTGGGPTGFQCQGSQ
jgi:hypothetical protein